MLQRSKSQIIGRSLTCLKNCFDVLLKDAPIRYMECWQILEYIATISPAKHHIKTILRTIRSEDLASIEHYQHLRFLMMSMIKLEKSMQEVCDYLCSLNRYYTDEEEVVPTDSQVPYIDAIKQLSKDEDKALTGFMEDLKDRLGNVYDLFYGKIELFPPVIMSQITEIKKLRNEGNDLLSGYPEIIENAYYDFLELNESDIEEELYNRLFSERIVEYTVENPSPKDWSVLLNKYLNELNSEKTSIIANVFSFRHAIDICDERIMQHIFSKCSIEADIELFFRCFAEIAILQEKTRSSIKMIRRPEPEEEAVKLPSMVVSMIREDRYLSKRFKEAICSLAKTTGKRGFMTKWSHVKIVLEHRGLICEVTPTKFGRQIHEICSDVDADNCRQNVSNNALKIPADKKYYELPDTFQIKTLCNKVEAEFREIIDAINI